MDKPINRKYNPHHYRTYSRKQVFEKTCGKYIYCGLPFKDEKDPRFTIEHLIPISKGGADEPGNAYPCCMNCNVRRGNKELKDWLELLIDKRHSYKGLYHITNRLDVIIINLEKIMHGDIH